MSVLVLRLAGPLQSWSGYRHMVSMATSAPTSPIPRKSAVSGIIGAALGPRDSGHGSARNVEDIGARYELHIRVEAQNPVGEDFQTLGPLPFAAERIAEREHRIAQLSSKKFPLKRGGGNTRTTGARRDFLAHSEFLAALEGEEATIRAWCRAVREPIFMPYLGRRSCPPSFPFLFGCAALSASQVLAELPHVDRYRVAGNELPALAGFTVAGGL